MVLSEVLNKKAQSHKGRRQFLSTDGVCGSEPSQRIKVVVKRAAEEGDSTQMNSHLAVIINITDLSHEKA